MADFSCYITIMNKSSVALVNGSSGESWGYYKSRPATNLKAGEKTSFHLSDSAGPAGSTGWAKYEAGEGVIQFNYDDPYGSGNNKLTFDNAGTGLLVQVYGNNSPNYGWADDGSNWGTEGQYPADGHPLSGLFVVVDDDT